MHSVAVQYMSDLHLERIKYQFTVSKVAPALVLAGDFGRFCDAELYRDFLRKQCAQFDMVLLIAGNHEYYGSSRKAGLRMVQSFVDDITMGGRLHFINRTRVDIPGSDTVILGCTLQSYIAPDYTRLTNDFEYIQDWRVRDHNEEHQRDLDWLKSAVVNASQRPNVRCIIVATHYAPAFQRTCHPLHANGALSQCFCSHALEEVSKCSGAELITHWIFGHTHWNSRFGFKGVTVLSNQRCNDTNNLNLWQRWILCRPFDKEATIR